ncbi:MAG: MCE family protein [Planctomycetales bacterium]|nr:MCE family protein [Planctomycetales bacterium]
MSDNAGGANPQEGESGRSMEIPQAKIRLQPEVRRGRMRTRLWWLTIACALVAGGLTIFSFRTQGLSLLIHFEDGHGLKPGDTLRYRGIDVGSVTQVAISPELSGVDVSITLNPGNEAIAVAGSRFWIQRPRLQLGQISGLETIVGAKYVGVLPGEISAERTVEFQGLANPLELNDAVSREIRIQFPAGEGLEIGNPVRFRGIAIGEVTYVELDQSAESVWVGVRLVGTARNLATAGTQFWIERPRLDLTEIRGLETLLGGRYVAMQPASSNGELQSEFVGLSEAPPLPRRDGSLEIELDAPRRLGLVRGAPATYRGLEVGRISNVELSSDGASVKVGVIIETEYTELVRDNSKWWSIGGLDIEANLRGIDISIESLSSWIRGGIAFATPVQPGAQVVTGHRFMLEPQPQPEWLSWQPRIAVSGARFGGLELPQPIRVVASWRASLLGLYRRRTVETWAVALDDGTLRVPSTFIDEAIEAGESVIIELAGQSFDFVPNTSGRKRGVEKIEFAGNVNAKRFPAAELSDNFSDKSVFLIVSPEISEPIALDGTRVMVEKGVGLRIAPGIPISAELGGSPVVAADTGKLYGLLVQGPDSWLIARIE